MKPIIKRTKQPDKLQYESKKIRIYINGLREVVIGNYTINSVYLTLSEAKELSKVLPKFLEEMERETK